MILPKKKLGYCPQIVNHFLRTIYWIVKFVLYIPKNWNSQCSWLYIWLNSWIKSINIYWMLPICQALFQWFVYISLTHLYFLKSLWFVLLWVNVSQNVKHILVRILEVILHSEVKDVESTSTNDFSLSVLL